VRYTVEGLAMAPLFCSLFWRGSAPAWVRFVLESRPLMAVGERSYSLYLYHFGCIAVVQRTLGDTSPGVQVLALVLLAFGSGLLSYRLVEAPARRLGASMLSRFRPTLVGSPT
jgi:peptidoglycan/LPS O-acetylase OafA/YrhL